MSEVRKATSVYMNACDDGLRFIFKNESETTAVTMDWVTASDMALRLDHFGNEALTMMQIGLDPYRSSHRDSFIQSWLEAGGQE